MNDQAQRLWLLQHTADHLGIDALDTDGIAMRSILPQFFGDADQPDALAAIRAGTAGLFDTLNQQEAPIDSGALGHLKVPVSIVFGESDRYLNRSLAAENSRIVQGTLVSSGAAGLLPAQHDQP